MSEEWKELGLWEKRRKASEMEKEELKEIGLCWACKHLSQNAQYCSVFGVKGSWFLEEVMYCRKFERTKKFVL